MADPSPTAANVRSRVERTFREESGRALATLIRLLGGDFEAAEEAVADAFVAALETWPRDGIPANPGAWITTSARNRALDRVRRARRYAERLIQIEADLVAAGTESTVRLGSESHLADDRLRLIFTCCHPALALDARVALTLRTLGGLTTPEIARAFLLPEATLAQRIVRAKRKIRQAGIPYRVPPDDLLAERLDGVLAVLYLVFNEGYAATGGGGLVRHDLCAEAIRLARLLGALLPRAVEARGLLALLLLQDSRREARADADGGLVLLEEQDRSRWDGAEIGEGLALVEACFRDLAGDELPGPYLVQAAIADCHARSASAAATPWAEIAALYGLLANRRTGPGRRAQPRGGDRDGGRPGCRPRPGRALGASGALADYHSPRPRADLLRRRGRRPEARGYERARAGDERARAGLPRPPPGEVRATTELRAHVAPRAAPGRVGASMTGAPPGGRSVRRRTSSVSRRTCRGPPCRREVPREVPIERSFAMMTTSPPRPASGRTRAPGHAHVVAAEGPATGRAARRRRRVGALAHDKAEVTRRRWGSDVEGQPAVAGSPPAPPTFPFHPGRQVQAHARRAAGEGGLRDGRGRG